MSNFPYLSVPGFYYYTILLFSVLSIDTKKNYVTGNFKKSGKALSDATLKAFDHDFTTSGNGTVVPHGLYNVTKNVTKNITKNVGYMTMGVSHDASTFVCGNIERV